MKAGAAVVTTRHRLNDTVSQGSTPRAGMTGGISAPRCIPTGGMSRPGVAQKSDKGGSNVGNRAACKEKHVVPNGARAMAKQGRCNESCQSGQGISFVQCVLPNVLSASPLVLSGQVFQVLGIRMHDVEMGGWRFGPGILRAGRQPDRYRTTG